MKNKLKIICILMLLCLFGCENKENKEIINNNENIPIYNSNSTVEDKQDENIENEQLEDDTNNKDYVLVEGLYDLNWVKTAINILGKSNEYIVLPSGGCGNIQHLRRELESYNKKCINRYREYKKSLKHDDLELERIINL